MAKVTVTHEGKEIEVELPAGYLSPDEAAATMVAKTAVEQIVSDRLARHTKSVKTNLLQDEEFRTEALTAWNIKPGEKGKGSATPAEIEQAIQEAERTRFKPLQTENETLKGKLAKLTQSQLEAQIVAHAAAVGVKKAYLTPLPGRKVPAIVGLVKDQFGYDEELSDWLVRNEDGKSFAVSGESGAPHPYKGVQHFFTDFSKNPEFREFLEPAQQGANHKGADKSSGNGKVIARGDAEAFGDNVDGILDGSVTVQ